MGGGGLRGWDREVKGVKKYICETASKMFSKKRRFYAYMKFLSPKFRFFYNWLFYEEFFFHE